ncbi:MAG: hypothetical protein K6F50_08640 [Kiritimatiellae bacterium]|nr:hypothetical protein [Kiritimatiellia bacterium]
MIEFESFLAKAYELAAKPGAGGAQGEGVGVLGGKVVSVSHGAEDAAGVESAKREFVDSAVAKFGEALRAEVEKLVDGSGDKPLSARTILAVDKLGEGSAGMVRQLSALLNRAAEGGVKQVSANDAKALFAGYDVSAPGAGAFAAAKAEIEGLASAAEQAMKLALALTPEQIVSMGAGADDPARSAVSNAIDISMRLAEKLGSFLAKTGGEVPGVEAMMIRAQSRAVELNSVVAKLVSLGAQSAGGKSIARLVSEAAFEMHGTVDALSAVEERLAPLMVRIASVKSGAAAGTKANFEDVDRLLDELSGAKAAVEDIAKNGIKTKDGGTWRPDAMYLKGIARLLENTALDIRDIAVDALPSVLKPLAKGFFPFDSSARAVALRNAIVHYSSAPTPANLSAIRKAAKAFAAARPDDMQLKRLLSTFADRCADLAANLGKEPLSRKLSGDNLVKLAYEGKLDVATVTGAKAWGATDDMVDLDIADANLIDVSVLGQGQANEVHLCRYRRGDGSVASYVFKPELAGEKGFKGLAGTMEGYSKLQSLVHLNAASKKIAELLGTPGIVVGAKVGCLHGLFGVFMEVAPGNSMGDMKPGGRGYGLQSKNSVRSLTNGQFATLAGNFLKAGSDLEWNDWLSGQVDRHWGNYFLKIDVNQNVSVKGIDNDLSFPSWRLGMTRFRLTGRHLSVFLRYLKQCGKIADATLGALRRVEGNHPAFTFFDGEDKVEIDLSKARELQETLKDCLGFQVVFKPTAISRDMFDRLMALDGDREKLRTELAPHIPEAAIDATMRRLDEMVAHAKELQKKGRVLDDGAWTDVQLLKQMQKEQNPHLRTSDGADAGVHFYNQGILVRDFETFYGRRVV